MMGAAPHREQRRRAPLIKLRVIVQTIDDHVHEKRTAVTAASGAGIANRCIISRKLDLLRDNPTRIWLSPGVAPSMRTMQMRKIGIAAIETARRG
jgi:hypothetical protein